MSSFLQYLDYFNVAFPCIQRPVDYYGLLGFQPDGHYAAIHKISHSLTA